MRDKTDILRIVHYHPVWLPLTMTWLQQITTGLSGFANQMILCEKTLEHYDSSMIYIQSFEKLGYLNRSFQRIIRKSGLHQTFPFYTNALKHHKSQLLHAHFGHIGVEGCKIAASAGIPIIVSFYGMDVRQIPMQESRWLDRYKYMFSHVKAVLCEGPYMARDIVRLGCPPEKIIVYPLGINHDDIQLLPRNWHPGIELKILMAASFREKKGLSVALEALASIKDEINFSVTIVGDAGNDSASQLEKKRMMEVISTRELSDKVTFTGFLPHQTVMNLAESHHIFLSPSKHAADGDCEGGAPVTIIEMAASGIIVISTTHCDIPGVVIHRETGWLAEENSAGDLADKIRQACKSFENWPDMARKARKHTEKHFDSDKQIQVLHEIYRSVIYG
jgi:colanic acid/amylovoran biosynthesis glycosyltransferase